MASRPITAWQIKGEQVEVVTDFLFWGSKITADSDCSHEIGRWVFLGREVMTNLDRVLKSRDITLPTKVHIVKVMVFPEVTYSCESWTIKKAECQRTDIFKLWCWRGLLKVPWQQRDGISQSDRRSTLNIPWKYWCWSWSSSILVILGGQMTHEKSLMLGKIEVRRRGHQRMRWLDSVTDAMNLNLG